MFCSGCGKQLPNGSAFCSACGKKFFINGSSNTVPTATAVNKPTENMPKRTGMIVTTTSQIEGYRITDYLTTVTGTDIYVVGGLFGGGMANQEKLFGTAYKNALSKMEAKANDVNADAIVGMSVSFTGAANSGSVIVALVGTAVKIESFYNIDEKNCDGGAAE